MHVRTATRDDLESVARVHTAAVRALDPGPYTPRQLDAWDHERDSRGYPLEDDDCHLAVAERDGRVVGFGQLHRTEGEVQAVYVHPDHTGQGVGSALLAHLEGRAAARGLGTVRLLASKNAVGFYERAGYRPEGEGAVESSGGVELDCVWMSKDLDGPGTPAWGRLPA